MKSEHRHELETNALAKNLEVWLERVRPYATAMAGLLLALVVLMFGWSLYSRWAAAQQTEAWNSYNLAVEGLIPNLELLRASAEEYPGSKMKELADITWADGQVWMASRDYVYSRGAATEALERARSAYEGVIRLSSDQRLVNRGRFGLARIFEMKNELEKSREEYLKVEGAFAELAKQRAEQLAEKDTQEAYAWLATAQPPRRLAPTGPGRPGQRPDFSADNLQLPGATPNAESTGGQTGASSSLEGLLQELDSEAEADTTASDGTEETPPETDGPASDAPNASDSPAGSDSVPAGEKPAE